MKLIWICLFIVACSSPSKQGAPVITETENVSDDYQIFNLGKNFDQFWLLAQGKPFAEQLKHWNEIVESPFQDVYDAFVDDKMNNKNWQEKKEQRLQRLFRKLPTKYATYKMQFDIFNETVHDYVHKYEQKYRDVRFKAKIYAIPGATFNGKVGTTFAGPKEILVFGIDVIDEIDDDVDVLFSHEMFHLYHNQKLGDVKNGKMTLPLFREGLASFASWDMNPDKAFDKIMMDADLANLTSKDIRWLAKEFLKIADNKDNDIQNPQIFRRWFTYGYQVRKNLPSRAGYLLGYKVVERMSQKHSPQEMSGWTAGQVHAEVKRVLRSL